MLSQSCWEYSGWRRGGYGVSTRRGQKVLTHRAAYEVLVGPIPAGLELDHLCRNRACYNPRHLEPVTHTENMRRAGALITHCPRGHAYTPENTTVRNGRQCRQCKREWRR